MLRCSLTQGCRVLSAWLGGPKWDMALDRQPLELELCGCSAGHIEQGCMLCCAVSKAVAFGSERSAEHIEQVCLLCWIFERLQIAAGSRVDSQTCSSGNGLECVRCHWAHTQRSAIQSSGAPAVRLSALS